MFVPLLGLATSWLVNQQALLVNQQRAGLRTCPASMISAEATAKAAWLAKNAPAWSPPGSFRGSVAKTSPPASSASLTTEDVAKQAWLAKNKPAWDPPGGFVGSSNLAAVPTTANLEAHSDKSPSCEFVHAPLSYFALDRLTAKGSRRSQGGLVDVGDPHDFTRPLAKDSEGRAAQWRGASVGAWACTTGGWDSPKLRPTTETFLVLDGEGSVTDADGIGHHFGAGDVVVLPKHWCGRWDIKRDIHKVWVVHDHPDVVGAANGIVRAVVSPHPKFSPEAQAVPVVEGALHEAPANVKHTIYDVGLTRVGFLSCSPGSFVVVERSTTECFFVVDGVFFLTNPDGSARRCSTGDTVLLPQGWSGLWNIIEPVTKVWIEVGARK